MNILECMDSKCRSYTKTDQLIYHSCKKYLDAFAHGQISDILKIVNVSQPALTRFAKKLGLSGFNEFQFQLSQALNEMNEKKENETRAEKFSRVLHSVEESLSSEQIRRIADRIKSSEHIYFYGGSLSQVPAEWLAIALRIIGYPYCELIDYGKYNYYLKENDTAIVFSVSGRGKQFSHHFPVTTKNHKAYQVLVTMNPKHAAKEYFDEIVLLPDAGTLYGSESACSDTMAFMMFCETLVTALSE